MNRTSRILTVAAMLATVCVFAEAHTVSAQSIIVSNQSEVDWLPPLSLTSLRLDQLLLQPHLQEGALGSPSTARCGITAHIEEAQAALESIAVSVGEKTYRYVERRAGSNVIFKDPEKTIALALMDSQTCAIQTVVITKRGSDLYAPSGYTIETVRRSNGIQWNNWATEFHISEPANMVVALLKYPYVRDETTSRVVKGLGGKLRTVYETKKVTIPIYYTPYSKELHTPELVQNGQTYLSSLAKRVRDDLRQQGVSSLAVPGMNIADVATLRSEFITRLAPIEHMDLTEFLLDPAWTTERIHVVIGANLDHVATYTCSKASACGLMQFTKGTYAFMRKLYPSAELKPSFEDGARDQYNAMKAAFLLHDYNASQLVASLGTEVLNDSHLEEYLAAAYNTGVGRVVAILSSLKKKPVADWADAAGTKRGSKLLPETKGYIAKLRYLRDQWQQPPLAQRDR